MIKLNSDIKLIFSDVDQTLTDIYTDIDMKLVNCLERLLKIGVKIVLLTGQDIAEVDRRIISKFAKHLRINFLVGACSGTELWKYEADGELGKSFYNLYETGATMTEKKLLRDIHKKVVEMYKLNLINPLPIEEYKKQFGNDSNKVVFIDRGSELSYEFMNLNNDTGSRYDLKNMSGHTFFNHELFRQEFVSKFNDHLEKYKLPFSARLAGEFSVDVVLAGVNKGVVIRYIMEHDEILNRLGLEGAQENRYKEIEVWGDKFSKIAGGTDWYMSQALDPRVRSISFRKENPQEFLPGYNIIIWDGQKTLQNGVLEYLERK